MNEKRFKTAFHVVDRRAGMVAEELPLLSVSQSRGVIPRSELMGDEGRAADLSNYKVCDPGDIVLNRMSAYNGAVGLANLRGVVSPDYLVMRPNVGYDGKYLTYLIRSSWFVSEMSRRVKGIGSIDSGAVRTPRIGASELGDIRVRLPCLSQQEVVADFLDRETAQIDAFIAKNEELIALLIERRKAMITHLITKGARGEKLKPSGIDWAGDVPDSWQVGNIRRFAAMHTGHTPSRQHPEYWVDCDIPWFTLADVWQLRQGRRSMSETSERISALGLANSAAELLPAGTVALSRTASVGFPGILLVPMATSQDFWNWIPGPQILSEFLWYQFLAMKTEFERLMTGSTHRTIYQADAASLSLVVPPIAEQAEIVARLDEQTGRLDTAVHGASRAIDLARERRAALISAAVTGKIDVGVSA